MTYKILFPIYLFLFIMDLQFIFIKLITFKALFQKGLSAKSKERDVYVLKKFIFIFF